MQKMITGIILSFLLLAGCGPQAVYPAGRLYQPRCSFSYVTPEGWMRTKLAGIDYIIVSTAAEHGVEPNIYIESTDAGTNIEFAVRALEKLYSSRYRNYQVFERCSFFVDAGGQGRKLVGARESRDGLTFATYQYVIRQDDRTAVITCTCAEQDGEKYEPIFDAAMKTIRQINEGK